MNRFVYCPSCNQHFPYLQSYYASCETDQKATLIRPLVCPDCGKPVQISVAEYTQEQCEELAESF